MDEAFYLLELLWLHYLKGEIFQLPLDRIHTQTMSKWRVDIERLASLSGSALWIDEGPSSSVMQTVAEFDHQYSNIFRHRDDHLA